MSCLLLSQFNFRLRVIIRTILVLKAISMQARLVARYHQNHTIEFLKQKA